MVAEALRKGQPRKKRIGKGDRDPEDKERNSKQRTVWKEEKWVSK